MRFVQMAIPLALYVVISGSVGSAARADTFEITVKDLDGKDLQPAEGLRVKAVKVISSNVVDNGVEVVTTIGRGGDLTVSPTPPLLGTAGVARTITFNVSVTDPILTTDKNRAIILLFTRGANQTAAVPFIVVLDGTTHKMTIAVPEMNTVLFSPPAPPPQHIHRRRLHH